MVIDTSRVPVSSRGGEEPDINFTGYPRGYSANRIADIKTLKVDYFFKGTRCILKQISSGLDIKQNCITFHCFKLYCCIKIYVFPRPENVLGGEYHPCVEIQSLNACP